MVKIMHVPMMGWCTCGAELGHHHVEDGDEEEGVGAEEEEDRPNVDPLQVGALHEGTARQLQLLHHLWRKF